ncbi:hypothetical protein IC761_21740 [Bradyrhizobium commune]|uniref:Uncharacterized protein n=1 Tax=Bradyrhizobium commune TaxID=83627 RepID=A0A7S9D294_9BRAD|nr:hypothetical protein IC761_21740 [Bradyrhizobium commune]
MNKRVGKSCRELDEISLPVRAGLGEHTMEMCLHRRLGEQRADSVEPAFAAVTDHGCQGQNMRGEASAQHLIGPESVYGAK